MIPEEYEGRYLSLNIRGHYTFEFPDGCTVDTFEIFIESDNIHIDGEHQEIIINEDILGIIKNKGFNDCSIKKINLTVNGNILDNGGGIFIEAGRRIVNQLIEECKVKAKKLNTYAGGIAAFGRESYSEDRSNTFYDSVNYHLYIRNCYFKGEIGEKAGGSTWK